MLIGAQSQVQNVAADQQTAPMSEASAATQTQADPVPDQQVAADESTAEDVVEGSGGGDVPAAAPASAPAGASAAAPTPAATGGGINLFSTFQSLFSRRIFGQRQSRQFFMQCNDRITMPCIVEGKIVLF